MLKHRVIPAYPLPPYYSLYPSITIYLVMACLCNLGYVSGAVPEDISLSANTVAENDLLYTYIGTLSTIDGDLGDIHTYSLEEVSINTPDNKFFTLRNDSLFSFCSFNYEDKNTYQIRIKTTDPQLNSFEKNFSISITDLTGKYDKNGIADQDLADKYPSVNVGDFLFLHPNVSNENLYYGGGFSTVSYPNKVLIRGDQYETIYLNLKNINGPSTDERIIITNFLGQVHARKFGCINGVNWRLTGEYDPVLKTGSPYYNGCAQNGSEVDFGFSSGKYGIWVQNEWQNINALLVYVYDYAKGFEIDHMEISDGAFSGLMLKDEYGSENMDSVYLHHLYIHDVNSEGLYIGSTGPDPQHMFNHLRIDNCYIARAGCEAIQLSQLGEGCVIENNVFWGAFDWLSPFYRYQDHVAQILYRNGGISFKNNILLGSANAFYNLINKPRADITPTGNPITISNNLNWSARGSIGAYQNSGTDSVTSVEWERNYWGDFRYDYDRVYKSSPDSEDIIRIATKAIEVDIVDNTFDSTNSNMYKLWAGSTAIITDSANQSAVVNAPDFRNLLGDTLDTGDYLRWNRWTAKIGEDPRFPSSNTYKGDTVFFQIGDIVQHHHNGQTRFYRCLQANGAQEPSVDGDANWELLTWDNSGTISYLPPDDARLSVGSYYQMQGIGLNDNVIALRKRSSNNTTPETNVSQEVVLPKENFLIQVYPNPANGRINFHSNKRIENLVITATDMLGNSEILFKQKKGAIIEFSIDGLDPNLYVLSIEGSYENIDGTLVAFQEMQLLQTN